MKQFLVLVIAITFVTAERDEGHLKDKRAISTVHISSPYSQVRYAPGYPNYGGEQSQYHGVYVPSARHSYPSGYPPIFTQEFPAYSPPVFYPQHPGFHYPQPQPPFLIPGQPCEGESPPSPGYPSRPPVFIPPHEDDAERIPPQPPMKPSRPPSKIPPSYPPSSPMKPMPSPPPPPVEEDSDEHEPQLPPLPPKPPVKRPPPPPQKPPINYPPVIPPQLPPPIEEDSDEHEPPLPPLPPKPPVKRPPPPPQKPPINYPPVVPPQLPPPIEEDSDEHEFPSPQPPVKPPTKTPRPPPTQKPPTFYPPPQQPPMKPEMPPVHYPPTVPWPSVPPKNIPPPPQQPPVEETPDCEGDVSYEDEEEEQPPTPPVRPIPPSPPTYLPPQLPPSRPMKPVLPPPQLPPPQLPPPQYPPPQLPPSRPMKPSLPPQLPPIQPPTIPSYPPKKPNCDEEEEEDIPQIPHYTNPYYPQSIPGQPSYQQGNPQTIAQQHPQNIPRVTTSRTPTEVHVTVQNMPGHVPRQDVPIPSPPPSQGPPTHLPENRPLGPRPNPSTPRIPYQPTNGYDPQYETRPQYFPPQDYYPQQPQRPSIPRQPSYPPARQNPTAPPRIPYQPTNGYNPQYDTGPQYFPPQDVYGTRQTPSVTPQYYPSYYPQQYPNAQYPYYSRNTQPTSNPADSGKQGGIPAHNNGQFLVETTQRSYPRDDNNNYAPTQTPYTYSPYNNRQQQNNFASESSSTTRPIYSNDGHYITMRPIYNREQSTTSTPSYSTTTPRMNRFEVRRPAIHKQFYDVEEKIIMRPVGSVILELSDDDSSSSNAIMKIKNYHPKNSSKHDSKHSYSGDRYNHSTLHGRNNFNNSRNNGSMKSGVTYADEDMPIHFRDSSELKIPMHIMSPFAAQVTQNKTKNDTRSQNRFNSNSNQKQNKTYDDSEEEDDEPSAAYLYGRNMIKVNHPSEKTVTPCPPPSTYARYTQEKNNSNDGIKISSDGEKGLRSNNMETTTPQNQRNYLEMLSGKNGVVTEVQSDYMQGNADNRVQGRLVSVQMQEATATEQPTEHTSVRRIMVTRPVETVQIVEMPEYKEKQFDTSNDTTYIENTTPSRIIYSNQKVETQTIQYEN